MYIYKITNNINGKSYIGKAEGSVEARFERHCRKSSGCPKIKNAIQKYGKDNFSVSIVEKCSNKQELSEKEIYWIKKFNTLEEGYNLAYGGEGGKISKESIEKIRKSKIGTKASKETKDKMSKMRKGHGNSKSKKVIVTNENGYEKEFLCLKYACEELNINYSTARGIAQGRHSKTRSGFNFKYLED